MLGIPNTERQLWPATCVIAVVARGDNLFVMTEPRRRAPPMSTRRIRRRVVLVFGGILLTNMIGAVVVFALIVWALPRGPLDNPTRVFVVNAITAGAFAVIGVPLGVIWGRRRSRHVRRWISGDGPPTPSEARDALRTPIRLFRVQLVFWIVAAAALGIVNAFFSADLVQDVTTTVALGGLVTSTISYLVTERVLRPLAARALAEGPAQRRPLPGITFRVVISWMMASAVPLLGLVIGGILQLADPDATETQLAVVMIVLGATGLVVGLMVAVLSARRVADPVRSVRRGMALVQAGKLDTRLEVFDGSELGLLQAGFNEMAAGLRERERLRDLFGRHVGVEVAQSALERGAQLGGEVRDVAILFVDMVGSTKLAGTLPPNEVVALLNRYFTVIVEVVTVQGGWVNKFEGDAALAVFGAPQSLDDPAGHGLAAARRLAERLARELPDRAVGIGVAYGEVVAGNVGAEERFEYTVIGDAVNEAARLCEQAKGDRSRVLASADTLAAASTDESDRWCTGEQVVLRGRTAATLLARPKS